MVAEIEMGHLATVHHQRAIKQLVFGLEKFYQSGQIRLEPLPETDIDPGNPESKCPDLILQDNTNSTVPIVIEIATRRGWRTDFAKMRRLIDETEYGIQEGFVYDFQQNEWHKYAKGKGIVENAPSWSEVLRLDLKTLLASAVSA
jgi:Uma2 family endonuclease